MAAVPSNMLPLGTVAPSFELPDTVSNQLDAVLTGEPVVEEQRPSLGCNIKWKES